MPLVREAAQDLKVHIKGTRFLLLNRRHNLTEKKCTHWMPRRRRTSRSVRLTI